MLDRKILNTEVVLRKELEAEYTRMVAIKDAAMIEKESKMRALLTETLELEKAKHRKEILENENKYKQAERDMEAEFKKEFLEQQATFDATAVATEKKLSAEFYGHLGDELKKLHSEGNFQTNFVKDLAIEMMGAKEKKEVKIIGNETKTGVVVDAQ